MAISDNTSSSKQRSTNIRKRIIVEVIIILVILGLTVLLCLILKKNLINRMFKAIELKPNSDGYGRWLTPPTTITQGYYLFNITNSLDIVTDPKSATIKFKDTPPYVYNLETFKTNVQWTNNNTVVNYAVEKLFTPHKTRSNLSSLNDTGYFLDLLGASFRTQFGLKPSPAFYALAGYNPFHHRHAVELLEGFTSVLFQTVREKMRGPNTNLSGFIYRQNGSRLYNISIRTDSMKKGQVLRFASEISQYKIESPSHYPFPVYDGLTYPPMLFDKPNLNIFNPEFCKPVLFQFNQVSKLSGIKVHEYKLKLIDYDNCTNPNDTSTCNEVDKVDVSKCVSDSIPESTIFLSKAHFYGSEQKTIEAMNVEGYTSNKNEHDSVIYFEPNTGTPVKVLFRIQINVNATIDPMRQSDENSDELEPNGKRGVKRLLPILWIDQEIDISERVSKKLRTPLFLIGYGQYVILLSALILTVLIIVIIELMAKRSVRNAQHSQGTYTKAETTEH